MSDKRHFAGVFLACSLAVLLTGCSKDEPGDANPQSAVMSDRSMVAASGDAAEAGSPAAQTAAAPAALRRVPVTPPADSSAFTTKIDELVHKVALGAAVEPVVVADDEAFLRRVTIDLIGRIPTYDEYTEFFADTSSDRRANLIARLLNHDRFNDRWAIFFGDMLRVRRDAIGGGQLHQYVRNALAQQRPYDDMVIDVLTAVGSPEANPAAGFFAAERAEPLQMAGIVAQTFNGVRIQCAQCHDHPYDQWTQQQYYELAAYFGRTRFYEQERPFRAARVVESKEMAVYAPVAADDEQQAKKPVDPSWPLPLIEDDNEQNQQVAAQREKIAAERREMQEQEALLRDLIEETASMDNAGGAMAADLDREHRAYVETAAPAAFVSNRQVIADLVTNPRNRYFAWNLVNRVWAELLGRGMVEPIDDFKSSNPPSHPELLDYLADEFVASDYNLRHLIALIVQSDTYQRSMLEGVDESVRENAEAMFASAPLRRMPAEALYDSLVVAGNLGDYKHPPGTLMRERTYTVRLAKPKPAMQMTDEADDAPAEDEAEAEDASDAMMHMVDPHLEDRNVEDLLTEDDPLMGMRAVAVEQHLMDLEMQRQAEERANQPDDDVEYEYVQRTQVYDANPRFSMASYSVGPAPAEHFLRQFGQTSRDLLGEQRDRSPSMRQALILLNGRLANEAARVGAFEEIHRLLQSPRTLDQAIERAYIEIFTRKPTAEELAMARSVLEGDAMEGMAMLRWAMLNSHEFRFMP